MDALTSTEFRKIYAKLEKPTIVTVNGHAIGMWSPISLDLPTEDIQRDNLRVAVDLAAQRFNTRPFTPVPKSGQRKA